MAEHGHHKAEGEFVTRDYCAMQHRTVKNGLWWLRFSIVAIVGIAGGASAFFLNDVRRVDLLQDASKEIVNDLKQQIVSIKSGDEAFQGRILKSMDETRTEMRNGDQRIDQQMRDLSRGQQEILTVMVQIQSAQPKNGVHPKIPASPR